MELGCKPNAVCISQVLMPRIFAIFVVEGLMRITRAHIYFLVEGTVVLFVEFLHSANAKNLSMQFPEIMLVVNTTIGTRGGIPQVEFDVANSILFRAPKLCVL